MNKPFTLQINDTRQEIVDIINNANLPAFNVKVILNDILQEIQAIDEEEIKKYKEENKDEIQ